MNVIVVWYMLRCFVLKYLPTFLFIYHEPAVHHNHYTNEPPSGLCDLRDQGKLETYWTDCVSDDPPECTCCSKCFAKKEVHKDVGSNEQ